MRELIKLVSKKIKWTVSQYPYLISCMSHSERSIMERISEKNAKMVHRH
jgi:hypothetical protein